MLLFLKSFVIGIAMAAPLGPISMLLIKKTLESGIIAGVMIAIGAASAEALYCGIAGVAMTSVTAFIQQYQTHLRIVGKILMASILISECRLFAQKQGTVALKAADKVALSAKIFFMTLANPVTILTLSGIFLSFSIQFNGIYEVAIATVAVFLGSSFWCISLSCLTAFGKRYMSSGFVTGLQVFSLGLLGALVIFL